MKTQVIADSACDLRQTEIDELKIKIMQIILISSKADEVNPNLKVDEIFKRQAEGESFKTSQIPEFEYYKTFEVYAKENIPFMYLSLSSGLTGGYNNACMALEKILKKYPQTKASIIDTKAASVGFGLFAYIIAKANQAGKTFDELKDLSKFLQKNICHIFTVFDLKYLYEGGRVTRAGKNISSMLNLMPIIKVANEKLYISEIIRGRKKSVNKMIDIMKNDMGRSFKDELIMPVYGKDKEIILNFIELLKDEGANKIMPNQMGHIIAAHVGPDIIGAGYLKEKIPDKFKDVFLDK